MRLARFLNTSYLDLAAQPLRRLALLLKEAEGLAAEIEEQRRNPPRIRR
jgi:hypothetical protein